MLAGYRATGTRLIAVDYTHPSAVNLNARLFHRHKIDFVMVLAQIKHTDIRHRTKT